jgi:hypothetical protein
VTEHQPHLALVVKLVKAEKCHFVNFLGWAFSGLFSFYLVWLMAAVFVSWAWAF